MPDDLPYADEWDDVPAELQGPLATTWAYASEFAAAAGEKIELCDWVVSDEWARSSCDGSWLVAFTAGPDGPVLSDAEWSRVVGGEVGFRAYDADAFDLAASLWEQ